MNMHVKAASKFKVGDAVVPANGDPHDLFDHWMEYWAKPGDKRPTKFYVVGFADYDGVLYHADRSAKSGPLVNTADLEPAPRFAVGDRVRANENFKGAAKRGDTATVAARGIYWCDICEDNLLDVIWDRTTGGHMQNDGGYYIRDFELLPPTYTSCAAAEIDNLADEYGGGRKFKVGDRVRGVTSWAGIDRLGTVFGIADGGQDNIAVEFDAPFKGHDFGSLGIPRLASGRGRFCKQEDLEHVAVAPATATLTIQAGKFYKTRDGRKVVPMVYHGGDKWPFGGSNGFTYTASGQFAQDFREHRNDLIAEWPSDDVPLRGVSPVVAPATTEKFKVGDRVKFRDDYGSDSAGKEATVIKLNVWGCDGVQVEQDGRRGISTESAERLELLPPATIADIVRKHSVVMLIENGQPKPSTEPFVHSDKVAAGIEASRLAGIHKGQEFGVYECVDVRKVEKTYDHEWQRLAARGSKIPAIKALRDLAGIDLAAAKSGVDQFLVRAA